MELIRKYFPSLGDQQLSQFERLGPLYNQWNAKINVISRKDIDALYERHVLHSLSIALAFPFASGIEVLDIGTGGGFPGIPLAIYFPQVRFHLLDSIAKKVQVVRAIATELELQNVSTEHARAEAVRRKFDRIVSRAVAPLKDLWNWSKPLLNDFRQPRDEGGRPGLICLKGGNLAAEIAESGTCPRQIQIFQLIPEEYFRDKYVLFIAQ
ncbi:MAG TPA: 16S rRNA (guanine(527)-N(7))-methyltransferase RsmG [Chitinophagaceae bacterium]|nr:16S rRNA (guanine(527)-N(7))-methyltransferase RsmG [Chitinophagaceae bacterium]